MICLAKSWISQKTCGVGGRLLKYARMLFLIFDGRGLTAGQHEKKLSLFSEKGDKEMSLKLPGELKELVGNAIELGGA